MGRNQIFFGRQVVAEALLQKIEIDEVYCDRSADREWLVKQKGWNPKIPVRLGLPKGASHESAQGVAFSSGHSFYLKELPENLGATYPRILLLNHLQDVQNLGAISRSAAAFGFSLIVHESNRSVRLNEVAVRISQGQAFRLHYFEVSNLSSLLPRLQDEAFELLGLDGTASKSLYDWKSPSYVGLILGSEESGIQSGLRSKIQSFLKIPMSNEVESLNVSHAASIAMSWIHSVSGS